jgi:hypothetical protein
MLDAGWHRAARTFFIDAWVGFASSALGPETGDREKHRLESLPSLGLDSILTKF